MTLHGYISIRHVVLGMAGVGLAAALTGCSGVTGSGLVAPKTVVTAVTSSGSVHGGQQPVAGASIQLYAVNPTVMQGASTALLTVPVTTNGGGYFNITNLYTCPANSLVYLVATGGDPGSGNNAALAMMAALGPCSDVKDSTFISVNELTTVASVYALAPFMSDLAHVGSSASNGAGMARAFASVNSLVNTGNGAMPGPALPINGTVPGAELNTLADIMAACVNSNGTAGSCPTLFAATTLAGGPVPVDTIAATLNMVRSPGNNVAKLFELVPANSPFQPTLNVAPQDWSVAIRYTGGGITAPHGIALDASGNVWIANEGALSVSEMSPAGAPLSGANGYTGGGLLAPQGIAVDLTGNVWVANAGGSSVVKLSPAGAILSGAAGYTGGINGPVDIAVDKAGNAWVANFSGNSITKIDGSGNVVAGPLAGGGLLSLPTSVAIDPAGAVWVSSSGAGTLVRFGGDGALMSSVGSTDEFLQGPAQVALSSSGQAFVAAPGSNSVSAFDASGAALPNSPYRKAGLNNPQGTAVDGADTVWVTNSVSGGSLSRLSASGVALSPPTGFGVLASPLGVAIDAAGAVWTANSGDNSVSQFVGIAVPVSLPLASRIH